jgi:hypothetical protein
MSTQTAKHCVFCGNHPEEKTKEHIIPLWLIELTGNPNRLASFGFKWRDRPSRLTYHQFSFDSFHFPACNSCNSKYSALESKAKTILLSLLFKHTINVVDISVLLDWLDKVRTGTWLGLRMLNKNIFNIEPNFYINDRVGTRDRAVLIYSDREEHDDKLLVTGMNFPIFHVYPTCFCLSINHLHFFNCSTLNIVSKPLGLLHLKNMQFGIHDGKYKIAAQDEQGSGIARYPIFECPIVPGAMEIYQPILPPELSIQNQNKPKEPVATVDSSNLLVMHDGNPIDKSIGKIDISGTKKHGICLPPPAR